MNKNIIYRANPDFVLRTIAGEDVLVSVRSGVADFTGIITLNDTATVIWKCLQNSATVHELIHAVTERFDVEAEQAEVDISEVIRLLEERKLISHE